jgi:TonB family protein
MKSSKENTDSIRFGKEGSMSSTNSSKNSLLTLGGILILALMAAAAIKSGQLPNFFDPYGFIFVLAGGIALLMVSFSGKEIRSALMHAVSAHENDAEIRISIFFWEAAGRSFWMLGGLRCILSVILAFEAIKTEASAGVPAVIDALARSLLSSFYGILLAAICLVPCWKLMEKLPSKPLLPDAERDQTPSSIGRFSIRYGAVIGYVLFVLILDLTIPKSILWNALPSIIYWPSLLVVLGGALALMLFIGGVNSGPPLSMSFASMGLIGFLMAFIQMLLGIGSSKIGSVVSALVFVLSSCFAALLGMILVAAPLEDRAVRTGRVAAPSAFSRAAWYGFPLLTLILTPLVIIIITTPLPRNRPQTTGMSTPVQEQRARYEARAPQSEPINFAGANFQERNLIYKIDPAYPEQARREGLQGTVQLRIIINEEGFVYEIKGNPGNNPLLERAAIPAVKKWRFSPFLIKNAPVALETTATVHFSLK